MNQYDRNLLIVFTVVLIFMVIALTFAFTRPLADPADPCYRVPECQELSQ